MKVQNGYTYFPDGSFRLFYQATIVAAIVAVISLIKFPNYKMVFSIITVTVILSTITFNVLDQKNIFLRYGDYLKNGQQKHKS